jgi:hypothetical protein
VTAHATGFPEEQQRAALFSRGHRVCAAAREAIDRSVGEHERKLEFGNRLTEHDEVDGAAQRDGRKDLAEELAVSGYGVEKLKGFLANRFIAEPRFVRRWDELTESIVELIESLAERSGGAVEAGDFDQFRWRKVRLRLQQMSDDRIAGQEPSVAFGGRKQEPLRVVEGIPDGELNRPFHINTGKNAV